MRPMLTGHVVSAEREDDRLILLYSDGRVVVITASGCASILHVMETRAKTT